MAAGAGPGGKTADRTNGAGDVRINAHLPHILPHPDGTDPKGAVNRCSSPNGSGMQSSSEPGSWGHTQSPPARRHSGSCPFSLCSPASFVYLRQDGDSGCSASGETACPIRNPVYRDPVFKRRVAPLQHSRPPALRPACTTAQRYVQPSESRFRPRKQPLRRPRSSQRPKPIQPINQSLTVR